MLALGKAGRAQGQQQPAALENPVPQDFLQAMVSLKKDDLKNSYVLKEFGGGVSLNGGKFYIGGNEVSSAEMAARAEKVGARVLPYLIGAYEPDQSVVYATSASLDGKTWKYVPRKGRNKIVMDKKYDVTALEVGTALLALSANRKAIRESIQSGEQGATKVNIDFESDGAIDAEEISEAATPGDGKTSGSWVDLMGYLYKKFSSKLPSGTRGIRNS